ncbi:hypothetical protein NLJ89_g7894 [Agrocybe chaxingu]|uniref:Uncharacterized protein n=1 Tax=Agrocybe chaxingu TaxID=84603 RepID=A0A9W8MV11_9AGAR|nr:hypothetical protein NLJ89_g7894 [Agrocybe chaxingu]
MKLEIDSFSGSSASPALKCLPLLAAQEPPQDRLDSSLPQDAARRASRRRLPRSRSRKTVKHQRGIVGADLAAIAAKRNQTAAVRTQQRLAAISKAKSEKKEKETKKEKTKPARTSAPSGPKVSKQQMKGGKGGR